MIRLFKLTTYCLMLTFMFGCASARTPVKKMPKLQGKVVSTSVVRIEPEIKIPRSGIKAVFIEDFESRVKFGAAGIACVSAIRSKFLEKGFDISESRDEADLIVEGKVVRCIHRRARVGFARAVAGGLADGKEARLYEVDIIARVRLLTEDKSYQAQLSGIVRTHEEEIGLAVSDAGLAIGERLVKALR